MTRTLYTEGILGKDLIKVDGDLVDNYNGCLEAIIGQRTSLKEFHIGKRGESPEIEAELGKNYLQNSPAHRHMIIITPEQKDSSIIHEEFSFDSEIMDRIYERHLPAISVITRVDGLTGELEDGVTTYNDIEDLLLVKKLSTELHTPSGFITASKKLKSDIENLRKDPSLLVKNDSALVREIYALAQEVGDVRDYNVEQMNTHLTVQSFYTRLFDGVYVFRQDGGDKKLKRPSRNIRKKYGELSQLLSNYDDAFSKQQTDVEEPMITVIYDSQKNEEIESGPNVNFIDINDTDNVIRFLFENKYALFDYTKSDKAMNRLAELHMVELGYDVANMSDVEYNRKFDISKKEPTEYLDQWNDVRKLQKDVAKGFSFQEALDKRSTETKLSLLDVREDSLDIRKDPVIVKMVNHLLCTMTTGNYEQCYDYNVRYLEKVFDNAESNHQDYILYVLNEHIKNKK